MNWINTSNDFVFGTGNNKVVLIVLDGADWRIINPMIEQGKIPAFNSFIENGSYGQIKSVGAWSSPNIATIFTGKLPEEHGITTHFYLDESSAELKQTAFSQLKVKPLWELVDGKYSTSLISFVEVPIAEEINNVMISSLYNFKEVLEFNNVKVIGLSNFNYLNLIVKKNMLYPEDVLDDFDLIFLEKTEKEMNKKGLSLKFNSTISDRMAYAISFFLDKVSISEGFSADLLVSGVKAVFNSNISAKIIYDFDAMSKNIAINLIKQNASDIYLIYFMGPDTFGHMYYLEGWKLNDTENSKEQLQKYYEVIDSYVKEIMDATGEDTTFILISDTGIQNISFEKFEYDRLETLNLLGSPPHSKTGIFLIKGPNIKKNNFVNDAALQDITPTILCILDVPIDYNYFSGIPLTSIFEKNPICN